MSIIVFKNFHIHVFLLSKVHPLHFLSVVL